MAYESIGQAPGQVVDANSGGFVDTIKGAAQATWKVVEDPHAEELICQILRLSKMEEGQNPGGPCLQTPVDKSPGKGIGLRNAIVPLRHYVRFNEQPAPYYIMAASIVAIVFAAGYISGKK